MAITFAWRSDTSTADARYGYNLSGYASGDMTYSSLTGALGGSVFSADLTIAGLTFNGQKNFGAASGGAFSMLIRYSPLFDTTPSADTAFAAIGIGVAENNGGLVFYRRVSNQLVARCYRDTGTLIINAGPILSSSVGNFYDFIFTGYINDAAGTYKQIVDTVTEISGNMFSFLANSNEDSIKMIGLGLNSNRKCEYAFNELVIWDEIIDPTNVTLVHADTGVTSTAQSLNGNSRTGWVDVAAYDKNNWTSITAAQIGLGVEQIQAGLTQTGTLFSETWSTLPSSDIKSGVEQIQNAQTVTGSYLWSSLTSDNIANGISQIQDSVTITGSLTVPVAAAGTAGAIDIPNIKEQVRWILDTNNTTTSSVLDLSASMSKRIQQIQKVNPENIALQATLLPAVTVFTKGKTVESRTIARNQVEGKRESKLTLSVAGMVWNQNFSADINNDPADQDLEYQNEVNQQ